MADLLPCPWCLSTPPRHDRCHGQVVNPARRKVGMELDSVGASIPVYDGPELVDCPCECQLQAGLW